MSPCIRGKVLEINKNAYKWYFRGYISKTWKFIDDDQKWNMNSRHFWWKGNGFSLHIENLKLKYAIQLDSSWILEIIGLNFRTAHTEDPKRKRNRINILKDKEEGGKKKKKVEQNGNSLFIFSHPSFLPPSFLSVCMLRSSPISKTPDHMPRIVDPQSPSHLFRLKFTYYMGNLNVLHFRNLPLSPLHLN